MALRFSELRNLLTFDIHSQFHIRRTTKSQEKTIIAEIACPVDFWSRCRNIPAHLNQAVCQDLGLKGSKGKGCLSMKVETTWNNLELSLGIATDPIVLLEIQKRRWFPTENMLS